MIRDFRTLRMWQATHRGLLVVYRVTAHFPREEQFGLTAQLRRAVNSVGASIAEGCARSTDVDSRRCFCNAYSEACEALHHCIAAHDLGYLRQRDFDAIEAEMGAARRMLHACIERLEGR